MKRYLILLLSAFVSIAAVSEGIDKNLIIAKNALRDGLWAVASNFAKKSDSPLAPLVDVESLARNSNWKGVLELLSASDTKDAPWHNYYLALAYYMSNMSQKASEVLDSYEFKDETYRTLSMILAARIAMENNDFASARAIASHLDYAVIPDDLKMNIADIFVSTQNEDIARKIWREVIDSTNIHTRAYAVAAANLKDRKALEFVCGSSPDPATRRMANCALGRVLIKSDDTYSQGAKMIVDSIKSAPDTEGAMRAFLDLAQVRFARGEHESAAASFREAIDTWPELSSSYEAFNGLGWSLLKVGKYKESYQAFLSAERYAMDDETRASALLKEGDALTLSENGKLAMEKYRLLLNKYPDTSAADKLRDYIGVREEESKGRSLFLEYHFEEAMNAFRLVAAKDPTRKARMDYFDVLCLYGLGRDDEAGKKAQLLLETSPSEEVRALSALWLAKFSYNHRAWADSTRLFTLYAEKFSTPHMSAAEAFLWASKSAFEARDFELSVQKIGKLLELYPTSDVAVHALILQGEGLIELARFDEAVLVLDRAIAKEDISSESRLRASLLKADAFFQMGADNKSHYRQALNQYRTVKQGEAVSESMRLELSYRIARTLEKLGMESEAIEEYYVGVVLAYREGRIKLVEYTDEATAVFSRAAFRLADIHEKNGNDFQAESVLEHVVVSDIPSSDEAEKRIDRIKMKGSFL